MDPLNVSAKFEVCSFTCSRYNSDWNFGWGCEPPILGKRRPYGAGDGIVRKSVCDYCSHRLSIVTFPLSLRVSEILPLLLQHATFSHPTSSLPKIYPCSSGSRWMAFGLRRANVLR